VAPPVAGGGTVDVPTPTVPPRTVLIKVTCRARSACSGTVKLKHGTTVVGKQAVRVRAGRSVNVRVTLIAQAGISAAGGTPKRLTASAPRGTRVTFV
jgi:hypothetical protein